MAGQYGHLAQTFGCIVMNTPVTDHAIPEQWLVVVFIALTQEVIIAGVLINLPGPKDVFGRFRSIGAAMP